jgi:fatty-acyl-CoA synthase
MQPSSPARSPDRPDARLSLLAAEGIAMKVPLTIGDFLRRGAEVYATRAAVIDEPGTPGSLGTVSYADLDRRARGMALALDNLGVPHGERVAIVSPNAARFQVSYFGVSGYGRVLVPVNYRLNAEEISYIIEHSGATVLLVDPESDDALRGVTAKHRIVLDGGPADTELFAPAPAGAEPAAWDEDEDATASINYTSGTTARPKGVQLTHRNCWLNAAIFGWHTSVTDRDVFLHTLPMFHCNGWGMPYAVTGMGVPQVVIRKIDGEEILRRVEQHGVTLMCGAPAVVAAILDAGARRLAAGRRIPGAGLTRIVVAGAPPPSKTIERVETELGWEFIQIYGLTETAPLLTINRAPAEWDGMSPAERARLQSRAGVPAVGVRIQTGEDGEVLARSNHVFAGYWQQPRESAEALADGWFHTGDKGHVEAGEYLVISDRKKDVIISGGENVSSIEVEDCLFQHAAVAEVAVIGVPHEKWGETVKALVVLRAGQSATEQALIEHCRSRLAHYKCPTSVEMRDALPRTATGKLQKFKLRAPYWEGYERGVN